MIIIIKSHLSATPNPERSVEIMTLRERDIDVCRRCPPSFHPSCHPSSRVVVIASLAATGPELKSRLCFTIDIVGEIRHLDNFVFEREIEERESLSDSRHLPIYSFESFDRKRRRFPEMRLTVHSPSGGRSTYFQPMREKFGA